MAKGRIIAKPEVCMGCHLCEIWCAVAHSKSKDIIKAFLYENPKPQPRIFIKEKLPEISITVCRHCEEPECVLACSTGALYKNEEGVVLYDEDTCISCYECVEACLYNAIKVNEVTGKILKCDLCDGLEYPYCVMKCPNNALEFIIEIVR